MIELSVSTRMHILERKLAAEIAGFDAATLLLAVSGGPDSVAMLRAALKVRRDKPGEVVVAHFNHQLRSDSDADEHFVVDLCRQLSAECCVGRAQADLRTTTAGIGLEAAARRARYEFLQQLAQRKNITHVLTAHTADDQAETVLHRILRGTGLRGLKGIQRTRQLGDRCQLVRPLLIVSRDEVLSYLSSIGQGACHDPTNTDTKQTRNRIRNELLPQLRREYNSEVSLALRRLADMAGEVDCVVQQLVDQAVKDCVSIVDAESAEIDTRPMATAAHYVVRQLLISTWHRQGWPEREMDHAQWASLEQMILTGQPSSRCLPGGVRAKRKGEQLLLIRPLEPLG